MGIKCSRENDAPMKTEIGRHFLFNAMIYSSNDKSPGLYASPMENFRSIDRKFRLLKADNGVKKRLVAG